MSKKTKTKKTNGTYANHTPSATICFGSRKWIMRQVWGEGGDEAVFKANALFADQLTDGTLTGWCGWWHIERARLAA